MADNLNNLVFVGTSIADQTESSKFKFPDNAIGRIVDAHIAIPAPFGTQEPKVCYVLKIQQMKRGANNELVSNGEEPFEEKLSCGSITNTNNEPNYVVVKWKDRAAGKYEVLPSEVGVVGDQLANAQGKNGVDKKSKMSIFSKSCEEAGLNPKVFNGYAPGLIGLTADFVQIKQSASDGIDRDWTCLGVGDPKMGKKIYDLQEFHAKLATGGTPAPAPAQSAHTSTPAPVVTAATHTPHTNGVSTAADFTEDDVTSLALEMIEEMGRTTLAGSVVSRTLLQSKAISLAKKLQDAGKAPKLTTAAKSLVTKADWFAEQAPAFGWKAGEDGKWTAPATN